MGRLVSSNEEEAAVGCEILGGECSGAGGAIRISAILKSFTGPVLNVFVF